MSAEYTPGGSVPAPAAGRSRVGCQDVRLLEGNTRMEVRMEIERGDEVETVRRDGRETDCNTASRRSAAALPNLGTYSKRF